MERRKLPSKDDWTRPEDFTIPQHFELGKAYWHPMTDEVIHVIGVLETTCEGTVHVVESAFNGYLTVAREDGLGYAILRNPGDWREIPLASWWDLWLTSNPDDTELLRLRAQASLQLLTPVTIPIPPGFVAPNENHDSFRVDPPVTGLTLPTTESHEDLRIADEEAAANRYGAGCPAIPITIRQLTPDELAARSQADLAEALAEDAAARRAFEEETMRNAGVTVTDVPIGFEITKEDEREAEERVAIAEKVKREIWPEIEKNQRERERSIALARVRLPDGRKVLRGENDDNEG